MMDADLRAGIELLRQREVPAGRFTLAFLAAPGDSLCFSLAWKFEGPLTKLTGLPPITGVCSIEA